MREKRWQRAVLIVSLVASLALLLVRREGASNTGVVIANAEPNRCSTGVSQRDPVASVQESKSCVLLPTHLPMQPDARRAQCRLIVAGESSQQLGCLFNRKPTGETEFDDLALLKIELSQPLNASSRAMTSK